MTIATHGKLKLMQLTERVSSKGTRYFTGLLGGLNVIAFSAGENEWGEVWDVFLQERAPKPVQGHGQQRPSPRSQAAADLFNRPLDRG
jgi:hypothetical protein